MIVYSLEKLICAILQIVSDKNAFCFNFAFKRLANGIPFLPHLANRWRIVILGSPEKKCVKYNDCCSKIPLFQSLSLNFKIEYAQRRIECTHGSKSYSKNQKVDFENSKVLSICKMFCLSKLLGCFEIIIFTHR